MFGSKKRNKNINISLEVMDKNILIIEEIVERWVLNELNIAKKVQTVLFTDTVFFNLITFSLESLNTLSGQKQFDKLFNNYYAQSQVITRLRSLVIYLMTKIDHGVIYLYKQRLYTTLINDFHVDERYITEMNDKYKGVWLLPLMQNIYHKQNPV